MLLVVIGAAFFVYTGYNRTRGNVDGMQGAAHPAEIVVKGDISAVLTGRGKAIANKRIQVFPSFEGTVNEIFVKEGMLVDKGTCLAKIGLKEETKMRLLNLKQKIQLHNFEKEELQKELGFQRELQEKGLAAQVQKDSLKNKIAMKNKEFEALKNETALLASSFGMSFTVEKLLQNDFSQFDNGCINSPLTGTVVQINKKVDDSLSLTAGNNLNPLFVLADLSGYFVDYKVNELDLGKIREGQQASIVFDLFPEQEFMGEIEEIDSIAFIDMSPGAFIDPGKEASQYKSRIRLLNPSKDLRPDLSCRVSIITETRNDVLLVPITSVYAGMDGNDYVMVETPSGPQQKQVTAGIADFDNVEILSGLAENEKVFVFPYKLMEGQAIMQADQSRTTVERILR